MVSSSPGPSCRIPEIFTSSISPVPERSMCPLAVSSNTAVVRRSPRRSRPVRGADAGERILDALLALVDRLPVHDRPRRRRHSYSRRSPTVYPSASRTREWSGSTGRRRRRTGCGPAPRWRRSRDPRGSRTSSPPRATRAEVGGSRARVDVAARCGGRPNVRRERLREPARERDHVRLVVLVAVGVDHDEDAVQIGERPNGWPPRAPGSGARAAAEAAARDAAPASMAYRLRCPERFEMK